MKVIIIMPFGTVPGTGSFSLRSTKLTVSHSEHRAASPLIFKKLNGTWVCDRYPEFGVHIVPSTVRPPPIKNEQDDMKTVKVRVLKAMQTRLQSDILALQSIGKLGYAIDGMRNAVIEIQKALKELNAP